MYRFALLLLLTVLSSFLYAGRSNDKKPKIIGQLPVTTKEEESTTLNTDQLIVIYEEDDDDDGEDDDEGDDEDDGGDLTMEVSEGDNYAVNGTTITPDINFTGILTVPVSVSNKDKKSNTYEMSVWVTEENDPPVITGQTAASISEGQSFEVKNEHLTVSDPDDTYPLGFSLTSSDGNNYTRSGNVITPVAGYHGTLSVPVTVHDGAASSEPYNFEMSVNSVNSAPEITGQSPNPITINEDASFVFSFSNLTVNDEDNTYPEGFTLVVGPGANYSVAGTTITPDPNYSGAITVPVTVNDGTDNSAPFNVSVNVTAVNDAPTITAQAATLATRQDRAITISISHVTVTDLDNTQFTLGVLPGANYTVSGSTITPSSGFSGTLTVPVTVNDGTVDSQPFNLQVSVNANSAPVITGQRVLEVQEDQSITLALTDLTVTDSDNNYPADFTLSVQAGSNYTVSGTVITPSANFNGTLSVPVTVSDGTTSSAPFNVQIAVVPVNDGPVINSQRSLQTEENQPITLALTDLTVTDPDNTYPDGFSLAVQGGTNYTVSGTTVTPSSGFSGMLSVPVTVNDGQTSSAPFNVQITVDVVNDAPVITGQRSLQISENQSLTLAFTDLTVSDPDNTYPNGFSMTVQTGDNYAVSGTTITPSPGFSGTLSIPVTVSDGQASSAVFNVQIVVSPVNDPPVITAQRSLQTSENQSITLALTDLTVSDPDNTYPNGFSMAVQAGTNYTVSGTTITPSSGFSGTLSVPVTVSDGQASSAVFNVQIAVSPVNDAPVITAHRALQTPEDTPIALALTDLTVVDNDNVFPNGFTLLVSAGTNYTVSGATITPAANFSGTLTVPVQVNDGANSSAAFNVAITVADCTHK
jgi:hypothetical protein